MWAGEGLRLFGMACRCGGCMDVDYDTLAGLLGMEDPLRGGMVEAIRTTARRYRVKMITGDYRRTAERIARNMGLIWRVTRPWRALKCYLDGSPAARRSSIRGFRPHPPAG